MNKHALVGLILCQAAALAVAADPAPAAGAAAYRCGGIGDAEQKQFRAEATQHDMLLTFSRPDGAFVADVDVKITSAAGATVLQARCEGPLMLVDLPGKGRYAVEAAFEGRQQRKSVTLGKPPARLSFTWPAS